MDMHIHWIQDQARQHQVLVIWAHGKLNKADHFTKLHGQSMTTVCDSLCDHYM